MPEIFRINTLYGIVTEHRHNSRTGAIADLYADVPSGKGSRLMHAINKHFWDWTGITYWTNFAKSIEAGVLHGRLAQYAVEGFDKQTPGTQAWLTNLKLTRSDLNKIKAAYEAQPKKYSSGTPYLDLESWSDQGLANLVANAMRRETDHVIVTPGAGDKLAMQGNLAGKLVGQFRNFGIASQGKLISRNASLGNIDGNHKATFYTGLFGLVLSAVLVDALKAVMAESTLTGQSRDGRDSVLSKWIETWEKSPGHALYNALDRSGTMWLLTEPSNIAQKMGLPNLQGAIGLALGDETNKQGASRFINRSPFDAALGPSASVITDIAGLTGVLSGGVSHALGLSDDAHFGRGDFLRAKRLLPFGNMPVVQQGVNTMHQQFGTIFDWNVD